MQGRLIYVITSEAPLPESSRQLQWYGMRPTRPGNENFISSFFQYGILVWGLTYYTCQCSDLLCNRKGFKGYFSLCIYWALGLVPALIPLWETKPGVMQKSPKL